MNVPALPIDRASIEALGWALLHFVWQGLVVAAVLAGADALLSRARARARYLAACAALLAMLALPIATFVMMRDPVGAAGVAHEVAWVPSTSTAPAPAVRPAVTPIVRAKAAITPLDLPRELARRLAPALPWAVSLWGLGVVLLSVRLLGGAWLVARLRRSASNVPLDEWQDAVVRLAHRVGVSRPVLVCRSVLVEVPTAIGWLKPVILVPASTLAGLAPAQVEAILVHELAHIRRHDYLVNLLQSVIETLLFYHPAVWWVSRRIRDERELCCDEIAVEVSGDAVGYARALCELESLRGPAPSLALAASGGSLRGRIARLLGIRVHRDDTGRGLAAACGAALILAFIVLGSLEAPAREAAAEVVKRAHQALAPVLAPEPPRAPEPVVAPEAPEAPIAPLAALEEDPDWLPREPIAPQPPDAPAPPEVWSLEPMAPFVVAHAAPEADANADHESSGWAAIPPRRFTVSEWIELSKQGLDADDVAAYLAASPDLTTAGITVLFRHGVSPGDVRAMRDAGLTQATPEEIARLVSQGVSADYVTEIRDHDGRVPTIEELVRLAQSGVSPEWFSAMRWMGYTDLSAARAVELSHAGVSAEYVSQLRVLLRRPPSLEQVRALQVHGVSVDYLASFAGLLPASLSPDDLVRMAQAGVRPELVRGLRALGYRGITVSDIVSCAHAGVSLELPAALASAGWGPVSAGDLVRLTHRGVTGDHISNLHALGVVRPSVSEMIRLVESGAATAPKRTASR